MPDDTVIGGEIVSLDGAGRPSFNALQNYGSSSGPLLYYVFDVMVVAGKDVRDLSLEARREILARRIFSKFADPIRESPQLDASLPDLIRSVKAQGLEGLVAKRRDSRYEAGQRSGTWQKMRVNQGQARRPEPGQLVRRHDTAPRHPDSTSIRLGALLAGGRGRRSSPPDQRLAQFW
jgi:ATP-dependent DNA ligase